MNYTQKKNQTEFKYLIFNKKTATVMMAVLNYFELIIKSY